MLDYMTTEMRRGHFGSHPADRSISTGGLVKESERTESETRNNRNFQFPKHV